MIKYFSFHSCYLGNWVRNSHDFIWKPFKKSHRRMWEILIKDSDILFDWKWSSVASLPQQLTISCLQLNMACKLKIWFICKFVKLTWPSQFSQVPLEIPLEKKIIDFFSRANFFNTMRGKADDVQHFFWYGALFKLN